MLFSDRNSMCSDFPTSQDMLSKKCPAFRFEWGSTDFWLTIFLLGFYCFEEVTEKLSGRFFQLQNWSGTSFGLNCWCFSPLMHHYKDSARKSMSHHKTVIFLIMYRRTSRAPGKCESQNEVSEEMRGLCS